MLNKNLNYNPDVLDALANLSNDEVFTPPKIVNQVLDVLPKELWSDKTATFLDPATKSGVFLREIAKRLDKGLKKEIPNLQERLNHIYTKQLFGIAITELTGLLARRSLYCSKTANGKYSVCDAFDNKNGNIDFERIEHTWEGKKCTYCGASKEEYDREDILETHAYKFIHNYKPNMKFDVIIGNPPYQLSTGGSGRQAKPIYQKFIEQAKKLNPRFLTMIIPARWYSGGMGLASFRKEMLNDKRIKNLVDYENSADVFPGVDIAGGVCYFLWDKYYNGKCRVTNINKNLKSYSDRFLNEFEIFIRQEKAISIIRKVADNNISYSQYLDEVVSPIKPFGMPTNYIPKDNGVPCWFIQKIGLKYANVDDISDKYNLLNKWKILVPKAPIAGQTNFSKPIRIYHEKNAFLSTPGECCTESYIVAGAFDTKEEALSFRSFLFTKIIRFLILQTVISQDINKKNFKFVPKFRKYEGKYTDEILKKEWNISDEEWRFIDSKILETH